MSRASRSFALFDLAPLADGAQHQHCNDAHSCGGEDGTSEQTDAARSCA